MKLPIEMYVGFITLVIFSMWFLMLIQYKWKLPSLAPFQRARISISSISDSRAVPNSSYILWNTISFKYSGNDVTRRKDHPREGIALNLYTKRRSFDTIDANTFEIISGISARKRVSIDCYDMVRLGASYTDQVWPRISAMDAVNRQQVLVSRTIHNCKKFKQKLGYITDSLTQLENDFPIAYSIVMYKDFTQFEMLFRSIYRPQNLYCAHVDGKTNSSTRHSVETLSSCFDNVFVVNPSINVTWGTFTVLEADLICLRELLRRSSKWKYFINLTGQEYPLRTNYELVKILSAFNGSNNIERAKQRPTHRMQKAGTLPYNMTGIKGAVHVILSRDFADFSVNDPRSKEVLEWAKKVDVPDEIYFSTLNYNAVLKPPGGYKGSWVTDDDENPFLVRFKNWRDNWPCYGHYVENVCVFSFGDLPLLATREELFANKFDIGYSPEALYCMEELIYNRTVEEYLGLLDFNVSYYETRDFVRNKF